MIYTVNDPSDNCRDFHSKREAIKYAQKIALLYPDKKAFIDVSENEEDGIIDYFVVEAEGGDKRE